MPVTVPRRWFGRRPATAPRHRVYAIGDIHGRFDLFSELVQRLEADNTDRADDKRITLILLGDVIDRGPSSQRLIKMIMSIQQRSSRLVVLLGNHEATLLDCIAGDADAIACWLRHGGIATLQSFDIDPPMPHEDAEMFGARLKKGLTAPVVEWLASLPLSIRCGDYFFCHAGVSPGRRLSRQKRQDLLWIREKFLDSGRNFGAVVVHGHSIVENVVVKRNRISLDTGAYANGVLSAVCLDGASTWLFSTDPDSIHLNAVRADRPAKA